MLTTGTIVMIVCVVLIGLLEIIFNGNSAHKADNYSIDDDQDFEGADGLSGILSLNSEDIDSFDK